MKELREFISTILVESAETHRCLDGSVVPIDSVACYDDVCIRIDDAMHARNSYPLRSDARDHYNGILKVLRRLQRKSKKFVDSCNT